jgi:diguanylate cyclase (GGDEF)-like protein
MSMSAPGRLGELLGRSVDALATSISERDGLQARLAYDATHDALTGLANRRAALEGLDNLLRTGRRVGALFIDLDDFKAVNDDRGHAVGDTLLRTVAERLRRGARDDTVVARIGGDEFLVVLPVADEREAVEIAHRLAIVLDEPVVIDGIAHRSPASIGVAVSMPDDDADRLLGSADAALYEQKAGEGGGVTLLDTTLRSELEQRHVIEADLRTAIATGGLELHYQPIVRIADRSLQGVEALVRWRRKDGTLVPPDHFINVAERSGLIVDLDRWVLHRALTQAARWRAARFPDLQVSVNVSARTLLSADIVSDVAAALIDVEVPGSALVLEVTETALLHDLDTAAARIQALKELGVQASIDDFGTGFTSVSQLRRLPIGEVKVDRSFVQSLDDPRDRVLVDLVVQMGTVLGIPVVGEGVETEEQFEALRLLGCRLAQGYLLGRPAPAEEFEAAITASASSA